MSTVGSEVDPPRSGYSCAARASQHYSPQVQVLLGESFRDTGDVELDATFLDSSNSRPPISWKNTLFSVVKQRAQHAGACSFDLDAADCFLELYTLIRNTRLRAETF